MTRHHTVYPQRKAFLERKGALKDKDKDEENNEDENFMVLDSVESADGESLLEEFFSVKLQFSDSTVYWTSIL